MKQTPSSLSYLAATVLLVALQIAFAQDINSALQEPTQKVCSSAWAITKHPLMSLMFAGVSIGGVVRTAQEKPGGKEAIILGIALGILVYFAKDLLGFFLPGLKGC